jgi:hypothetical protein
MTGPIARALPDLGSSRGARARFRRRQEVVGVDQEVAPHLLLDIRHCGRDLGELLVGDSIASEHGDALLPEPPEPCQEDVREKERAVGIRPMKRDDRVEG